MFRRRQLACSFCGKSEAEVKKLVAGPKVFICDQCVSVASQIMQDHNDDQPPHAEPPSSLLGRVLKRIVRAYRVSDRSSQCEAIAR
jgi:ATP-dependent Clp protease ATP-binding subunit ClpX